MIVLLGMSLLAIGWAARRGVVSGKR